MIHHTRRYVPVRTTRAIYHLFNTHTVHTLCYTYFKVNNKQYEGIVI